MRNLHFFFILSYTLMAVIVMMVGRHRYGTGMCTSLREDVQKVYEEFILRQHLQVGRDT